MGAKISDQNFATLLQEKAVAGDSEFQFRVGVCYEYGHGIEKNSVEAVKWYKLAAKQGHATAQHNLGYAFDCGEGVDKNPEEAEKWYRFAAEQGHVIAQNNLAVLYDQGEDVALDYDEARQLYILSADQGYWRASMNLGAIYLYGKGVGKNLSMAKHHYEKALADVGFEYEPATEADKQEIQEKLAKVNALLAEEEKKRHEEEAAAALAARIAARTQVFISYARKDAAYRDELRQHLNASEIDWWDDTLIQPGDDWNQSITDAIARMKVAVLLVSVDFMTSEYILNTELPQILAAEAESARIFWLPIRPCTHKAIAKYQAYTNPKSPLAKRSDAEREEVYTELAEEIVKILETQ